MTATVNMTAAETMTVTETANVTGMAAEKTMDGRDTMKMIRTVTIAPSGGTENMPPCSPSIQSWSVGGYRLISQFCSGMGKAKQ